MADLDPADDNTADILYFILYFVITCFAVFFLIIVLFLCFSGRICFYIYYMVYKIQVAEIKTRCDGTRCGIVLELSTNLCKGSQCPEKARSKLCKGSLTAIYIDM